MHFQARVFKLAKDPEHPGEYQDACQFDPAQGVAAVADGVASSLFSAQWAQLLTAAVVADPPDPDDRSGFAHWLQARREAWSQQIDVGGLAWFQKAKLPLGAFSTLLWVHVVPIADGQSDEYRLQAFAIGDSCLFHARGGDVLGAFPLHKAAELEADPIVIGSVDLKRDQLVKFAALDEPCYRGDLLVLCTDAVAEWAFRQAEAGSPPHWNRYWDLGEAAWQEEVRQLRERSAMRYDDATLVLLRVGAEVAAPEHQQPLVDDAAQAFAPDAAAAPVGAAQTPAGQPGEEYAVPVEAVEPGSETPVAPIVVPDDDWVEKLRSFSQQVSQGIDQVSDQMLRGMKTLKEKALEKYRDSTKRKKK